MVSDAAPGSDTARTATAGRIPAPILFLVALRLGLTSFGGPAAHIGYFRREFVERRGWLNEEGFADLLALCQFLPGPGSSQFAFAVGYLRGEFAGALAAWLGFTLPSAVLMLGFAGGLGWMPEVAAAGWLHGLKVAAVAVVAQAVWQMGRALCPDWPRLFVAAGATAALLCWPAAWVQMVVIGVGAVLGGVLLRNQYSLAQVVAAGPLAGARRRVGLAWLGVFGALLVVLPMVAAATGYGWVALVDRFYRVGSLVFGGGHVVLPLLESEVVTPGWLGHDTFLAGYGAAQALPGPLFSFSAFLGSVSKVGPGGVAGGMLALIAIFLPGLLLVLAASPFWQRLRRQPAAQAALRGANAAVVGILAAAFCRPVLPAGVTDGRALALAVLLFAALQWGKVPAWAVVLGAAAGGWAWL
ncbi:MAG: chromate efflux transporter [Opitutaceae bacterium]|nr:chromate efflux transporter [Opitutaceae bacterium]